MDQPAFSGLEHQGKKRKTRREQFLGRIDALLPWQRLEGHIVPHYPRAGRGRHPCPLPVMLRIHCVQLFYNLSAPGMEDLLYESGPVRRFVGLKLTGPLPDETTILNFRHLTQPPPPIGEAPSGPGSSGGNQCPPGIPGTEAAGGDHRRCRHHRGAAVRQEPVWLEGP